MKIAPFLFFTFISFFSLALSPSVDAWAPLAVKDDPLVRMPGTQPEQGIQLEAPGRCLNCHAGYNTEVEPGFNWKGSMMAHAARDFLFWACLTVSGQDSIWAIGRPNAVDLCERCHFPKGWLEGRSDPPNVSAMTGADYDGVQCDSCHTMYDPFFETTYSGTREGSNWSSYWDETNLSDTPSQPAAEAGYLEDTLQAESISLFNGASFFGIDNFPFSPSYTENGAGQYFVSAGSEKRGPFADAAARHQMLYSRYHKSKYMCSACHDVSNPVLQNIAFDGTLPGDGTTILPTEENPAYSYFHVERTFSEFMLSDYGQQGGAPGVGPFAPDLFQTSYATNAIAKCQDCHMRDLTGVGCDKTGVPVRPTESTEHPGSGQPLHDLTGGNVWVSSVLASAIPGSPNYDAVNHSLLNQGPTVLTLDLAQGEGIDPVALLAGADRARQQLELAASINDATYDSATGAVSFKVQNQTGHKLISGFPEGRRMFVNIRAYGAGDTLIHEVNPYSPSAGTLKGLDPAYSPNSPPLEPDEIYLDELLYEMHPSSTLTDETKTFHFALATGRYKDNRIPPKGFRIAAASERLVEPVWHGTPSPGYFTAEEYAGGYDQVSLTIVPNAATVAIRLYYQTTSREYIEFLRDEINGTAATLTGTGAGGDPPYIIQTDPFFARLKAWGDTIWQLWEHNMSLPGAAPVLMAEATIGNGPACSAPVPVLESALPGQKRVDLIWSDEHTGDTGVTGYRVYYDQAGKAQLVGEVGLTTVYTDTDLTNGQQYCYKVTSIYPDCESGYSNLRCAIPSGCDLDTDCDDGLYCNGQETCDVITGACLPGTDPCPDDGQFCNGTEACDEIGDQCFSSGDPCPGTACNLCQEDTGTCFDPAGTPCTDDGNTCTDDYCDGGGACVHAHNTLPCNDGIACTENDSCAGGACSGTPNDTLCSDGNVCTDDSCTPGAGCSYDNNLALCDDGLFCTAHDQCSDGLCAGSGNPCTPPLICQEDDDMCTVCLTDGDCDDDNPCTDDVCSAAVNECVYTNTTGPCDDGIYCNGTDTCSQGTCSHSGDPCTPQLCDEDLDLCVALEDTDGDGIPDGEDNCPEHENPSQEDTYPPQGNGIGDACDCESDFNCDGNVDAGDVTLFLGHFGRSTFFNPCTTADPCHGDFDCNVSVDAGDVDTLLEDFGRSQFFDPCPACFPGDWCTYE